MSLFYIWIFEGIKQTKYNVFNVVLPIPVNAKLINSQLKLLLEAKKKKHFPKFQSFHYKYTKGFTNANEIEFFKNVP